ncbi:PepSY domain-containing protein [Streptomyces enissocaesilis]|uniref:PepSY domain-containing protein n=1 Tax=Streptomyces enissocaesilis TaxID=332589 RepID=A0ABP6JFW1_9ACTN
MKRKLVIATAATALLFGGTATAFATSDDDAKPAPATSTITLDEATAAAVRSTPGTVAGAELDGDDPVWEIDVFGEDTKWHDVEVDTRTAKVVHVHTEDDEDRDRAPKNAKVTMDEAVAAALEAQPGTLTSIGLDGNAWEAEVRSEGGKQHELNIDATTAKVTPDQDDADDADDDNDSD